MLIAQFKINNHSRERYYKRDMNSCFLVQIAGTYFGYRAGAQKAPDRGEACRYAG